MSKKIWIYGIHAVGAALKNPKRTCFQLNVLTQSLKQEVHSTASGIPCNIVDKSFFIKRFGENAVHQGVALELLCLEEPALEDLCDEPLAGQIILALDQVTDPHNVGAIIRSAAAFGARAIITQERHAPEKTSAVLAKTACGGLEHIDWISVTNLSRALEQLKQAGYWVSGLDEGGEPLTPSTAPSRPLVLVLGAEGEGLRRLVKENCDFLVRLPTMPNFGTLNVSNAAAVALYACAAQGEKEKHK